MLCIGWSVMAWDWNRPPLETIQWRILRGAGPGGITLLHDGQNIDAFPKAHRSRTMDAVPQIIQALKESGYKFATVPELMALDAAWAIPENLSAPPTGRPTLEIDRPAQVGASVVFSTHEDALKTQPHPATISMVLAASLIYAQPAATGSPAAMPATARNSGYARTHPTRFMPLAARSVPRVVGQPTGTPRAPFRSLYLDKWRQRAPDSRVRFDRRA